MDYLDSAVGLGAVDEKLFVARSRCLTSLQRRVHHHLPHLHHLHHFFHLHHDDPFHHDNLLGLVRPAEAMEEADKALAQNRMSTRAIIAKVNIHILVMNIFDEDDDH